MNKVRKEYRKSCEISEITSVTLGGFRQKIAIEGKRADAPVVLFLHGGPGFPPPFCVGARGLFREITDRFIAVYWDQYGSGINRAKVDDSFSIKSFVAMTEALIGYLKSRFPAQKLYLFSISWGSVLSAYAARSIPEHLAGVCAAGQVVLPPMLSESAFEALAQSKAPERVKRKLQEVRTTRQPTNQQIALLSKNMRKYTSAYGVKNKNTTVENPMKEIFASDDYSFADKIACFSNGYRGNTSLLRELSTIDLRETLAGVEVPYCIFGGDRDLVTCAEEARECVVQAQNPNLTFVLTEEEGHIPSAEAMKKIFARFSEMAGV